MAHIAFYGALSLATAGTLIGGWRCRRRREEPLPLQAPHVSQSSAPLPTLRSPSGPGSPAALLLGQRGPQRGGELCMDAASSHAAEAAVVWASPQSTAAGRVTACMQLLTHCIIFISSLIPRRTALCTCHSTGPPRRCRQVCVHGQLGAALHSPPRHLGSLVWYRCQPTLLFPPSTGLPSADQRPVRGCCVRCATLLTCPHCLPPLAGLPADQHRLGGRCACCAHLPLQPVDPGGCGRVPQHCPGLQCLPSHLHGPAGRWGAGCCCCDAHRSSADMNQQLACRGMHSQATALWLGLPSGPAERSIQPLVCLCGRGVLLRGRRLCACLGWRYTVRHCRRRCRRYRRCRCRRCHRRRRCGRRCCRCRLCR